jgi:DNA-binding Xre family transcriptional regulator
MKRGSTLFLKLAVILMGIPVLALCLFLLPQIANEANEAAERGSDLAYVVYGILMVMYVSAIPFYFALYQSFNLLSYIDKNQAFSKLSVRALKKIKNCAIIISGLYLVALPFVYIMAEVDDAPGLIIVGMVPIFASVVIAVFAAVLQRLLKEAIDIKEENDLIVWAEVNNMAIIINIDVMLAKRKMSVTELSEMVGITMANLSILKNGKAKAIRLSTLEAICKALECQPGDLLEYKSNEEAQGNN